MLVWCYYCYTPYNIVYYAIANWCLLYYVVTCYQLCKLFKPLNVIAWVILLSKCKCFTLNKLLFSIVNPKSPIPTHVNLIYVLHLACDSLPCWLRWILVDRPSSKVCIVVYLCSFVCISLFGISLWLSPLSVYFHFVVSIFESLFNFYLFSAFLSWRASLVVEMRGFQWVYYKKGLI